MTTDRAAVAPDNLLQRLDDLLRAAALFLNRRFTQQLSCLYKKRFQDKMRSSMLLLTCTRGGTKPLPHPQFVFGADVIRTAVSLRPAATAALAKYSCLCACDARRRTNRPHKADFVADAV